MESKTVAEITLQGTLQEFLTFVQSFSFENGRIQVRGERDWVSLELMTPYAGHRYQQIGQFYKLRWDGHARGSVVQLPNGKALLRLWVAEGAWESLTPLWEEVKAMLKKHGFLDSTADKATEQTRQETEGLPIPEGDELLTDMPPIPGQNGATWDDTFDWYYRVGRGKCPSLKNLAGLIGMEEGTVYNNHSKYKAQYEENQMR